MHCCNSTRQITQWTPPPPRRLVDLTFRRLCHVSYIFFPYFCYYLPRFHPHSTRLMLIAKYIHIISSSIFSFFFSSSNLPFEQNNLIINQLGAFIRILPFNIYKKYIFPFNFNFLNPLKEILYIRSFPQVINPPLGM